MDTTAVPASPPAAANPTGFGSLYELQDRHAELVKAVGANVLALDNVNLVATFIGRAAETGRILDAADDRTAAQGLINFWVSRLSSATRSVERKGIAAAVAVPRFDDTVLKKFDPTTLLAAAANADAWLNQSPANRDLVRRLMLRFVRLLADGLKFDPVPTVRASLYDLDTLERVDTMLEGLAAAGVVRVTKADTPELDRVAVRSPELTTEWPAYEGWLNERRRFREGVQAWDRAGRPAAALATGDHLEEARSYFDRDGLEREFLEQSRRREWQENEKNRLLKWVFLAIASVALPATVAAVSGWVRADMLRVFGINQEAAKSKATELGASADSTSTLAIGTLLMTEEQAPVHAAKKVLIIQTLRAVLYAGQGEEVDSAAENWRLLRNQLTQKGPDPDIREWFADFFEKHKTEIQKLTSGGPVDRTKLAALRTVTLELKPYILRKEIPKILEAFDTIRPVLLSDAVRLAEPIKNAAADGKLLSEVDPYRVAFWRLSYSGLLLVADEDAQKEFADALQKWEDVGGKAPFDVIKALDSGLTRLRLECKRPRP